MHSSKKLSFTPISKRKKNLFALEPELNGVSPGRNLKCSPFKKLYSTGLCSTKVLKRYIFLSKALKHYNENLHSNHEKNRNLFHD